MYGVHFRTLSDLRLKCQTQTKRRQKNLRKNVLKPNTVILRQKALRQNALKPNTVILRQNTLKLNAVRKKELDEGAVD